ncbi:hypothetical protein ACB092_09G080900 [Castanea dentata]
MVQIGVSVFNVKFCEVFSDFASTVGIIHGCRNQNTVFLQCHGNGISSISYLMKIRGLSPLLGFGKQKAMEDGPSRLWKLEWQGTTTLKLSLSVILPHHHPMQMQNFCFWDIDFNG